MKIASAVSQQTRMKKYLLMGCAFLGLLMLAGCMTPIGVNQVSPRQAYRHLNQNALNSDHCSADTIRVLHRYDLDEAFESNPDATLKRLQAIAYADDRRDLLYALSELSYRNADRQRRSGKPGVPRLARDSYFASAIYAYLFLFGQAGEPLPSPFDLRFRTAGDIYNLGLAQGLVINTNAQVELASGPRDTPPGVVAVHFDHADFPWKLDQIQAFYSADEFIVRGLSTRNRDSGLGAPLIIVSDKIGRFNEERRAPATVFLRVSGNVRDWSAGKLSAKLELYSAYDATKVDVNGMPVPLQTDTTAPLAQGLNNSPIWNAGVSQFFSAEATMKTGIRLMQPYSPGKDSRGVRAWHGEQPGLVGGNGEHAARRSAHSRTLPVLDVQLCQWNADHVFGGNFAQRPDGHGQVLRPRWPGCKRCGTWS